MKEIGKKENDLFMCLVIKFYYRPEIGGVMSSAMENMFANFIWKVLYFKLLCIL